MSSGVAVVDASALAAMLAATDEGSGTWARDHLSKPRLIAPHLVKFETCNVLRRQEAANLISPEAAALAHFDLGQLDVRMWGYEAVQSRVWELRHNLTCYDASYVAVAELCEAPLFTLDRRIARAPGIRCEVETP